MNKFSCTKIETLMIDTSLLKDEMVFIKELKEWFICRNGWRSSWDNIAPGNEREMRWIQQLGQSSH
jgi:hypothetical protein